MSDQTKSQNNIKIEEADVYEKDVHDTWYGSRVSVDKSCDISDKDEVLKREVILTWCYGVREKE